MQNFPEIFRVTNYVYLVPSDRKTKTPITLFFCLVSCSCLLCISRTKSLTRRSCYLLCLLVCMAKSLTNVVTFCCGCNGNYAKLWRGSHPVAADPMTDNLPKCQPKTDCSRCS